MRLGALLLSYLIFPMLPGAERVFLFAGQSNMCAYGTHAADLPLSLQAPMSVVQCLYSVQEASGTPSPEGGIAAGDYWRPTNGVWEDYAAFKQKYWYVGPNPGDPWTTMGAGSGGTVNDQFGPEFNAARTIQAALGGTQRIVKYAKGGTSLQNDWATSGDLYRSMKYWADKALASRPGAVIGGMFWMQGEADATWQQGAVNYQANLANFIARIRSDFGDPNLPFIMGRIHHGNPSRPYGDYIVQVRQAQAAVAASMAKVAWVDTDDLSLTSDDLHLDTSAILTLGTRMGQAWMAMNPPPVTPTVAIAAASPPVTAASPIPFTLTFSEPVSGFIATDVAVINGVIASFSGAGAAYAVAITPVGPGTVSVTVPANVAQSSGGVGNAAGASASVVSDLGGPTAIIALEAGQSAPLTSQPARLTVAFSRDVSGLAIGDFRLATTTGGSLHATLSGAGSHYVLSIDGLTGSGDLTAALPADSAEDAAGHPNQASATARMGVDLAAGAPSALPPSEKGSGRKCGFGAIAAVLAAAALSLTLRCRR